MDISLFIDNALHFLGNYGFILVIIFGITHGLFDNPWSFINVSLALTIMHPVTAYILLLSSSYLGSAISYYLLRYINKRSNNYFYEKRVSSKALVWLETQPIWKHMIVIGMPLVPTIQFRVALPFTKMPFKKYMAIIAVVYLFLYTMYSFVFYGLTSFITDTISKPLGIILIALFCIYVYFGKDIRNKLFNREPKEVTNEN